jgi:protease secretion system outer membrane protein
MTRRVTRRCVRLRAFACAAALLSAAQANALDLADAYRLALTQDATIRESRAVAQAGRERLPQARAQFMPNISLSAARAKNQLESTQPGFQGVPFTNFDRYNSRNDALTLRQPIFRKQLADQYRQAEALAADANATLEKDEQSLVMRVTEAYFNTLYAEEQITLIGLQKNAYAAQVDSAKKTFTAGAGTRTDIDEAQARYDMVVAQELEARQNLDLVRRQLEVLINQPVRDNLARVDVSKMPLAPPTPAGLDEWTALAESQSPEIESARRQIEASRAQVEIAKSGHYPTLDAVASIARTSNENITSVHSEYYQKQVGLQLTVPIFQGGYVNSQVREALARLEQYEDRFEEVRRDLGVRVHREFRGVTEGVAKVRALEQAVKSTEQLVVSSRRSFEAGARTRLDILNAEQQAGQARRDLAQARFTYLLSRVRLRALAGGMRPGNIEEVNGWLQH